MRKDPEALRREPPPRVRNYHWTNHIELVVSIAAYGLATPYKPFAHLFGFVSFEEQHGDWPEVLLLGAALIALQATYLRIFRHSEQPVGHHIHGLVATSRTHPQSPRSRFHLR